MSDIPAIEQHDRLRNGDFTADSDPLSLFSHWMEEASRSEPNDPNAMALATAGKDGFPDVRMVLLKGFDEAGFVFYTNLDSAKGRELTERPQAALAFHWKSLRRQVRIRGLVTRGVRRGGRCLFREPAEAGADRRLGKQAIVTAGKQTCIRESRGAGHRSLSAGNHSKTALLVGLSRSSARNGILA